MIPWPATVDRADDQLVLLAVGLLEGAQRRVPRGVGVLRRGCAAHPGKRSSTRALDLAVVGEHHEALAGGEEVVDPRQRRVQLAARGKQLERVQPHQALGAQRRGDLRVELAQVERLALQPRHHVALGEAVLGLVVELHRHHRARLGGQLRQHLRLQATHEAARAQMPVQAQVRVGPAEAPAELRARAEVRAGARGSAAARSAPAGRFITGVPVSAITRPSRGTVAASRCTAWVRLAAAFLQ